MILIGVSDSYSARPATRKHASTDSDLREKLIHSTVLTTDDPEEVQGNSAPMWPQSRAAAEKWTVGRNVCGTNHVIQETTKVQLQVVHNTHITKKH